MNKPTQEEIMKKWTTALGSIEETKSEEFSSLLPIAMKVAAKTIAMDLCFASKEEIDAVKSRVQSDNRDGKIDAIIEDGEFTEKKLEDDEEYKKLMKKGVSPMSAPSSTLFYLDYKYGDDPHKKTRRSKKKKMAIFKSPGVYSKQIDISIVRPKFSKKYLRRIKIGKIFGIDVPNVIITSTPKGIQIW